MKLQPGSMVLNQDLKNPMGGEVISQTDRDVKVKWSNGLVCDEDIGDITLTADVEFEHTRNVTSARADVRDAISVINELRADHVQAMMKIDKLLGKLGRAETQLYAAVQPTRLASGKFTTN